MLPHSLDEERRLISLAQAGDRGAFCALAQGVAGGLLRAAVSFGCDQSTAEDLAQETLLEAWRSLDRFDGRCRLSTWLFGILRNRWLKSRRKKALLIAAGDGAASALAAATPGPDVLLEQAEASARLRQAIADLPASQRDVLELRFFGQASLEEIAKVLDCPLGTVKSRLHHGLEKLRQLKFD